MGGAGVVANEYMHFVTAVLDSFESTRRLYFTLLLATGLKGLLPYARSSACAELSLARAMRRP